MSFPGFYLGEDLQPFAQRIAVLGELPSLSLPPDELERHCEQTIRNNDLSWFVQYVMIHALEKSAAANHYYCRYTGKHDGWWDFKGSIDTRYIADAIEYALRWRADYARTDASGVHRQDKRRRAQTQQRDL